MENTTCHPPNRLIHQPVKKSALITIKKTVSNTNYQSYQEGGHPLTASLLPAPKKNPPALIHYYPISVNFRIIPGLPILPFPGINTLIYP
jgi:hypothetical protein